MSYEKIIDHAVEHKLAIAFAGGIAAAIIGKKVLKSPAVKNATTDCVANALAIKQDAEERLAEIKADAEEKMNAEEAQSIDE